MNNTTSLICRLGSFAVACLLAGCTAEEPARHVVVFIDRSCSVSDAILAGYRADWQRIVDGLEPGDRLTMGPLTTNTYTGFRSVLDEKRPTSHWLLGNRFRDAAKARVVRERMLAAFDDVQQLSCSQRTPVLDTVSLAGKLLSPEASSRILILLSDMMEDAEDLRFDRTPASAPMAERIVSERRRAGILPNLRGAEVYVSGAAVGVSNRQAQRLEQFWQAYFSAAAGEMREYRPSLLGFGPAPDLSKPDRVKPSSKLGGERLATIRKDAL